MTIQYVSIPAFTSITILFIYCSGFQKLDNHVFKLILSCS